jgi:signal transduction histidine kinase/ActR/RegA family two-component response regulator
VNQARPQDVLIVAPRGRDGELTEAVLLRDGLTARRIADTELVAALEAGAGCLVITYEMAEAASAVLATWLAAQPPWSDFPLIVLSPPPQPNLVDLTALGNVTVLERPIAPPTLVAAVKAALRGRLRQYDARAAIQQRDQFLAMLGHELRNPLAAIVLAAELARTSNRDRDQVSNRIEMIDRQAKHLARLVDDLLDVARVTSGKVQLHKEAVAIDDTIRTCIETLADRARARGITVAIGASCGAMINGDRLRLEQVISNLLGNAIKYSAGGRTVTISSTTVGSNCEIRVRDQGIGIEASMLPHVFELFTQAESSLDRADGGMGIGLTLVDRLVRLHGGEVVVTSAGLGQGSEFVVRLPLGEARAMPGGVVRLPVPAQPQSVRVVLVEDNADIRELMAGLLEEMRCTVDVAVDGLAGVELIVRSVPDLAIVDIGLPGIDGFEVARRVRAALGRGPMLVAVTGYGRVQDRDEALAAGFDLHAIKPLKLEALQDIVDRARTATARKTAQRS